MRRNPMRQKRAMNNLGVANHRAENPETHEFASACVIAKRDRSGMGHAAALAILYLLQKSVVRSNQGEVLLPESIEVEAGLLLAVLEAT